MTRIMNQPSQLFVTLTLLITAAFASGQENASSTSPWKPLQVDSNASLRGLHVVSDTLVWASGTGGTVLKTTNGGETWGKFVVAGAEMLDFRDIHAFDENSAVIMSAGTPARLYRTDDGGRTWKLTFEHSSDKAFFDAISFWDAQRGIAMSDPIDDRVLLVTTDDGGRSWKELDAKNRPLVQSGEGGFAASGTNMILLENGDCLIALGSAKPKEEFKTSRLVRSSDRGRTWQAVAIPLPRNQSSGVFSMAFADNQTGVAVGGNYLKPDLARENIAVTSDGGKTWKQPAGQPPRGYRSGVAARITGGSIVFIAVGTNGTDLSDNLGHNWQTVSQDGFHAIQFSPSGKVGFASGANGRIARWQD